ncbi:hypothetical protein [Nocardia jiangsuensis]|uniref:Uncharacterized protein n=1 Tax=Nocardia jiangsuensis TaxID=1691563 RepID=A0ABV8DNK4_9NOCA
MITDPAPARTLLRSLRRHRIEIPAAPETRDHLLGRVHDAWRTGRLSDVGSIATALTADHASPIPGRVLCSGLTNALISGDNAVLPLAQQPVTGERPLRRCALARFDHSDCALWTLRAHSIWLAWALARIPEPPVGNDTVVAALFSDCPGYGHELLTEQATARRDPRTTAHSRPRG